MCFCMRHFGFDALTVRVLARKEIMRQPRKAFPVISYHFDAQHMSTKVTCVFLLVTS